MKPGIFVIFFSTFWEFTSFWTFAIYDELILYTKKDQNYKKLYLKVLNPTEKYSFRLDFHFLGVWYAKMTPRILPDDCEVKLYESHVYYFLSFWTQKIRLQYEFYPPFPCKNSNHSSSF